MYIRLFVLSLLLNGCQSKNQDKPSPIESYFEIEETNSAKSKAFELYPTEYRILKDRSLVHRINGKHPEDAFLEDYAFNKISTTEAFQEVLQNSENIKSLYISHFNPEVDISTFPNLLCLKLNHIDSLPKGIYELKKLKILIISNVEEVEFTKSISQLKELKYLEILFAKNINIPSEIKLLNNLKSVKINHSKVDPSFRNFVNLSNLEKLDIDFEEDKHLKGISKLKKLKMLSTNRVIPEVGDLNLEMLELDNDVHSNYPIELGKLDSLKIFKWVDNNQATIAPSFIGELKNLELVHFVRCNEFNLIPESYSNLEYIRQFKIDDCPSYTKVEHYLNEIKPMMNIHSILN